MLTVHHLGVSQSDRIVWLCEELGISYVLERYDRDPVTKLAPAEYKALHPTGTAPVISDGNLSMAESGAIIEYIIAKHGDGRLILGPDHPDFAQFLYWYRFADGSLIQCLMMVMSGGSMADIMRDRANRNLGMLEAHFGEGHRWLAGDEFTVADIMAMFPLVTMCGLIPIDLSPYSNLQSYLRRVIDRPAFKAAMAKADPGREIVVD